MDSDVTISRLVDRPEYAQRMDEPDDSWPAFMGRDKLANALFLQVADHFPEYCVLATDPAGRVIARGRAIPFDSTAGKERELFPDSGWDSVLQWGFADHAEGRVPDAASALDIVVDKAYQGRGLSARMLGAMRDAVAATGLQRLVAPVRPNAKHLRPAMPMRDYAALVRDDGLPLDPWLRVHVRAGGRIVRVAPASMVMAGSLAQWRAWTGLPFDTDGPVEVPEALVPVQARLAHEYAVYVEPNVWVLHDLA